MNKEITEKIFKILFPDLQIQIKSFVILPRKQMNETYEWVDDTPSCFVGVMIKEYPSPALNISEKMTLFTGYEFNVFTE
jgi:hypothetical protein